MIASGRVGGASLSSGGVAERHYPLVESSRASRCPAKPLLHVRRQAGRGILSYGANCFLEVFRAVVANGLPA